MLLLFATIACVSASSFAPPERHFECNSEGACRPLPVGAHSGLSRTACELTCGTGNLWPVPRGKNLVGSTLKTVSRTSFSFAYGRANSEVQGMLQSASLRFLNVLTTHQKYAETSESLRSGAPVLVSFIVEHADQQLDLDTDESYTLSIKEDVCQCGAPQSCQHEDSSCLGRKQDGSCPVGTLDCRSESVLKVEVTAKTYFGSRHALETLSQLVVFDELKRTLVMPSSVTIEDEPAYAYRGLLLDAARHFLPVWMIKKSITAMSYSKLNRLHLHLTDTGSFPVQISSQPNMTKYGAYSAEDMYSKADIQDLVQFGREHGVQIIPEIDAPAHARQGWNWGPEAGLGELVICNADPALNLAGLEPPSGQMNIVNENLYSVLADIYGDVADMFDSSIFHLGGDEVLVGNDDNSWAGCWNLSIAGKPIIDYIAQNKLDRSDKQTFYGLWKNFTKRALNLTKAAYSKSGKKLSKIMQWGGFCHSVEPVVFNIFEYPEQVAETFPASDFMIQVWDNADGSVAPWLTKMGYSVVLSHQDYMYLDCGGSGWEQPGGYWCQPKHEWYRMYDYIPDVLSLWNIAAGSKQADRIEGGEAVLWGERSDKKNLEQQVWPRAAALAERLWSNPPGNWYDADPRMQLMRERLVQRNISAEALQPQWCYGQGAYACTIKSVVQPEALRPQDASQVVV